MAEYSTWLGKIALDWLDGEFNLFHISVRDWSGREESSCYRVYRAGTDEVVAVYPGDHTGPLVARKQSDTSGSLIAQR